MASCRWDKALSLTHTSLSMPPLQVEWENAELKGQLLGVKQERDSALRRSQGLQSKLESLEQVLKVRGSCRRHEEKAKAGGRASEPEEFWCYQP